MKNVKAILAAAVVAAGLGSSAYATTLGALIGDSNYQGKLVFKYTNYDEGQIYNTPAYNPAGGNSYAASSLAKDPSHTFTDISTVDSRFAKSDSWGIFRVSEIYKFGAATPSWSAVGKNIEITGVFWGIQDKTVVVENDGSVSVYGVNTNYALFLDSSLNFDPTSGPTTSVALSTAIDGTAILTGVGSPIGLAADPTADFKSNYSIGGGNELQPNVGIYSSGISLGTTSAVNIGGSVVGAWNGDIAPKFSVQFSGVPYENGKTTSWDVLSNDPLMVTVIPTPTAVWGGIIMAGFVGLNVIRRRRAE